MKPFLHVISGTAAVRSFSLRAGTQTIGRENAADIQIPSKEISRQHARITVDQDTIIVRDLGSSNGTIINGKKIQEVRLKHKDQIILGDVILEYRDEDISNKAALDVGKTMYQQATKVMTERLKPKNLWPFFFGFFALAFICMTLITHFSYRSLLMDRLTKASISQAQNLVRYLAEKNRSDMKNQNYLLLDVTSVESEPGVLEAMIISNKGRVLAPSEKMDKTDLGPFVMEAMEHPSNDLMMPSPVTPNGHQILVHPIRVYDDRQGKSVTLGVAKILFSAAQARGSLPETKQLLYIMLFLSLLISMGMAWLASMSLSQPILLLAEKIQRWRTGQVYQSEDAPFKDWDPLYQAVERAIEDVEK